MAKYYIAKNKQRLGPFDLTELLANGLTPDTHVFSKGMEGWAKAKDVAEVAALFAPAAAPEPAAAPQPVAAPKPVAAPQPAAELSPTARRVQDAISKFTGRQISLDQEDVDKLRNGMRAPLNTAKHFSTKYGLTLLHLKDLAKIVSNPEEAISSAVESAVGNVTESFKNPLGSLFKRFKG